MPRQRFIAFATALALLAGASFFLWFSPASAAHRQQDITPTPEAPSAAQPTPGLLNIGDDTCLSCHGQPGQKLKLENGEELDLYIDPQVHANSIHGSQGYACVQCHRGIGNYPHAEFKAADARDVSLKLVSACQYCHPRQFELTKDSVHAKAAADGKREAAICTDCHSAHAVQRLTDPTTGKLMDESKLLIPQMCARCHSTIYEKYAQSVHGSALTDGNPDVPTCIDCHGVHNIQNPMTSAFRTNSPTMCAKCHTNEKLMAKYKLSTDVLNTYVSDFHGTTVTLFEKQSPDAPTNKPVCFDCHGVHDISSVKDPNKGLEVKQNLLVRCKVCHPDANENFPTAWMSHYIPSPDKYPLVYYVNLFYAFLIPVVLGGMAVLVVMDFSKIARLRLKKQKVTTKKAPTHSAPQQGESIKPPEAGGDQEAIESAKAQAPETQDADPGQEEASDEQK
jgi:hypothetical protein